MQGIMNPSRLKHISFEIICSHQKITGETFLTAALQDFKMF